MNQPLQVNLTKELLELENFIIHRSCDIEQWFRTQWLENQAPFYGSVDLRNSGFKLAPVDMNLFPGGFNNLNPDFARPSQSKHHLVAIEKVCPEAKRVLIIPEKHTRNIFYLKNLYQLKEILKNSGLEVRIGSVDTSILESTNIDIDENHFITIEPIKKKGRLSYF